MTNVTRIALVLVLVVGLAAPPTSNAGQAPVTPERHDKYPMYGPVFKTCGSWTATKHADDDHRYPTDFAIHVSYQFWVLGVVSGMAFTASVFNRIDGAEQYEKMFAQKETDGNAIFLWIDQYCTQHPLDSLIKATLELTHELQPS